MLRGPNDEESSLMNDDVSLHWSQNTEDLENREDYEDVERTSTVSMGGSTVVNVVNQRRHSV
jgi:nucleosome binding factor SPN SPT16 subunit